MDFRGVIREENLRHVHSASSGFMTPTTHQVNGLVAIIMTMGTMASIIVFHSYGDTASNERDAAVTVGIVVAALDATRIFWQLCVYKWSPYGLGLETTSRVMRLFGLGGDALSLGVHIAYFYNDDLPNLTEYESAIVAETALGFATIMAVLAWVLDAYHFPRNTVEETSGSRTETQRSITPVSYRM
jgi:hypothetical protein